MFRKVVSIQILGFSDLRIKKEMYVDLGSREVAIDVRTSVEELDMILSVRNQLKVIHFKVDLRLNVSLINEIFAFHL